MASLFSLPTATASLFSLPTATASSFLLPLSTKRPCISCQVDEIRVCTNQTCRRQGSFQILDTLTGLAPVEVSVNRCGCLARCGAGPNLVLLPEGVTIGHCGTAARAAEVILAFCYQSSGEDAVLKSLDALAMRRRAENEIEKGNFSVAELMLSQAIESNPVGGVHVIYKHRSVARLAMRNHSGALEDAREALRLASRYPEAYICEGDALLAMDQFEAAENSFAICLQLDPSIRRSKSFKARIAKLQEKMTAVNTS